MSIQKKGLSLLPLVMIIGGMILAACGTPTAETQAIDPTVAISAATPQNQLEESPSLPTATPDGSTATPNQVILPNVEVAPNPEPLEPPEVKTELEATDPASVVLASGKPQLVEFFAFW